LIELTKHQPYEIDDKIHEITGVLIQQIREKYPEITKRVKT
jgi:hypothetical protein